MIVMDSLSAEGACSAGYCKSSICVVGVGFNRLYIIPQEIQGNWFLPMR